MSDIGKQALKTKINTKVYENSSQAITGSAMNEVLQDMVDTLCDGANLDAGSVTDSRLQNPVSVSQNTQNGRYQLKVGDTVEWQSDLAPYMASRWLVDSGGVAKMMEKEIKALFAESIKIGSYIQGGGAISGFRGIAEPIACDAKITSVNYYGYGTGNFAIYECKLNDDNTMSVVSSLATISAQLGEHTASVNFNVHGGNYILVFCNGKVGYTSEAGYAGFTIFADNWSESSPMVWSRDINHLALELIGTPLNFNSLDSGKVDKEQGKGLSTNDFTNEDVAAVSSLIDYPISDIKAANNKTGEDADSHFATILEGDEDVTIGTSIDISQAQTGQGSRAINTPMSSDIMIKRVWFSPSNTSSTITLYELRKNNDGKYDVVANLGYYNVRSLKYVDVNKVIHKGHYLAFKLTGSWYYTTGPSGSGLGLSFASPGLSDDATNLVATTDNYQWGVYVEGVTIGLQTALNLAEKDYDGETYNFGYSIDNATLNIGPSYSGSSSTAIILYNAIPKKGVIRKIRCKGVAAGNVDFYIAKKQTGNTFDIRGLICSANIAVGDNTIDVYCPINKGEYIAVVLWISIGATIAGQPSKYSYLTNTVGTKDTTVSTDGAPAVNVDIETNSIANSEKINENPKQDAFLYNSNMQGSEWTIVAGSWSGFESQTANSFMYLDKPTGMDRQCIRVELTLVDTSLRLGLCGQPYHPDEAEEQTHKGQYIIFDFGTKKIELHYGWDGDVTASEPTLRESANMMSTLYQNRKYILELEYETTKTIKIRVIDGITQEVAELVHTNTTEANSSFIWNLPVGLLLRSGHAKIVRVSQYPLSPVKPTLLILGDSYTQGWNLIRYGFDSDLCYSHLVEEWLGKNHCSISCRGGETALGFLTKLDTDMQLFKPKYTLIAYGLNDDIVDNAPFSEFKERISKIINAIRRAGSEPILMNYSGNNNPRYEYSAWVSGYALGFRCFDIRSALALDNTFTSNPNLFLEDFHPNVEGNARMFASFKTFFSDLLADRN